MEISRRSFLKASAVAATFAVAGVTQAPNAALASSPEKGEEADKWSSAPCRFCGTGCGMLIGTKDNKIVAVKGDPKCKSNQGMNCVKGYYIGKILYGKDRFTKPMIRDDKATKGTPDGLREATWDEALDLVAKKLKEAHTRDPRSIAFYGSGQATVMEGYASAKFMKAGLLTNNIDPNARLCMASAVTGFMSTFQSDEPMGSYEDIDHTDVFVTWGSNMAEAHPVLFGRVAKRKMADENVKHYDLTTIPTMNADISDSVMVFRPQTDLVILNAIANYIIQNGGVDEEFLATHCVFKTGTENLGHTWDDAYDKSEVGAIADKLTPSSYDEYKAKVSTFTLEYASQMSGVSVESLTALAQEFCNKERKIISFWTMGANQHSRGTWVNNLIYNLHLLTGKIGQPGNTPFSLTGQPSACGSAREPGAFSHRLPNDLVVVNPEHRKYSEIVWNLPAGYLDAIQQNGFHTIKIFRELSKGNIKFLWSMANNWAQTLPKLNRFRGINADAKGVINGFIVVSEPYPTKSTELADVVFPPAMWVEREGQYVNAERSMNFIHKCVDAPDEAKSDLSTIVRVANRVLKGKKIGDKDAFDVIFGNVWDKKANDVVEDRKLNKTLFEEYRLFTNPDLLKSEEGKALGATLKLDAKQLAPYEVYDKAHGLTWPVRKVGDKWLPTKWRYAYGKQEDGYDQVSIDKYGDGNKYKGVDFYKSAEHKPSIIFRPFEEAAEVPDAEFPFWFTNGRVLEHWHSSSMTGRIPELRKASPYAVCDINKKDAMKLGLVDGDLVKIISRRGEFKIKITTTGRNKAPEGLIYAPFNFEETLINNVTIDCYDPISKEPDFKKCAVKIVKV